MAGYVQLPDGSYYPVQDGVSYTDAMRTAYAKYPEAFGEAKSPEAGPQSGGIAALKAGTSRLKSDVAALLGRTGAISEEDAEKYIAEQKKYQAKTFKPTEEGWTDAPFTKFAELLGGSAPYMAAPLAAGAGAVFAPALVGGAALTGTAATIAGAAAAGSTSAAQFTGTFLSRQMETGKTLGQTDLGVATLAAIPAAALDTFAMRLIPGIRGLMGSVGKEVTEAEARAFAQQGLARTLGDYVATTGRAAGVEGLTESAQQFLERLQAGLNISNAEARQEYVDGFIGGVVLGGALSVPGRAIERGRIKTQAEKAEQKEREDARAAAAQAKEAERLAEEARKQDPAYMRQAIADSAALEQQKRDLLAQIHKAPKGQTLTEEQKQENIVISQQLKELKPKLEEAAKESNRVKPLLAQIEAEARLAGMSPEEFMLEQLGIAPVAEPSKAAAPAAANLTFRAATAEETNDFYSDAVMDLPGGKIHFSDQTKQIFIAPQGGAGVYAVRQGDPNSIQDPSQFPDFIPQALRAPLIEYQKAQLSGDPARLAQAAEDLKFAARVASIQPGQVFEEYQEAAAPTASAVEQYVEQQTEAAKQAGALTLQDRIDYLMADPIMADQIVKTRTPMPDLSKQDNKALLGALELQLKTYKKKQAEEAAKVEEKVEAERAALRRIWQRPNVVFNARTQADVRELEGLRRQTEVTDQGELFGETASKTVLGQAPKTRRELLADLRIARAAGDNKAGMEVIDALRKLDDAEASRRKFQTGAAPEFRLTGEERQRMFESGMTEEQIDEAENRAQKAVGQVAGTGKTPMSVALQQMASESRADAFAEIVDLINRYNKGAAKREQLDAARERLISGLITDIQQTRGRELTDTEKQDITRNANVLLRELIERFGDTRALSQKGKDVFVPAQTSTGEFRTDEVPGTGFPTIEAQAPGRQTFGSPFAAAQSIREGLEELRTQAIAGDTTQFTRTFTPRTVSADAVETQVSRELAKDPKAHSKEQRNLLEAIADNLRMMLRPQTRQDVSDWLYDLARDPKNVAPERTQAVRDALQAVEQAKRSETEIETREFAMGRGERVARAVQPELPLGPGRELRRTELEGPQKPAPAGTFSQISTTPTFEEVQPAVFGSYAELEKYLASDALQQVRSAMGLGMPTLARLQARVAPFMARINAARAQAEALSKQAVKIEAQKRAELEALKAMSAKDLAAESQALLQARKNLDDAKRRLAELEAPLKEELKPLIKEFAKAQQQFEAAVAAQERTMAIMLYNRQVFENREIAAIEALHRVQRRMQRERSKIYKAFQEDFGNDPLNLARMMREFKETKQGAFNEQLAKAHAELNKVFFDTRKDDAAILRFLKESAKLDSQLAAQNNAIDTLGEKLLNAGLKLEVVRESQLDIAENRDEIIDARAQTQDAQRAVAAIEAKQRERLAQVNKLEDELGLSRTEIPHRISEDTTVAEVLRASTDSEKALVQQVQAALDVANDQSAPVRALQSFKRNRDRARAAKPETAQQTKDRDEQQQRLIEAIGRDPASFEGERISAQQRRDLLEELGATEETKAGLEAVIAAADEAIPATQEKIATTEKELKKLDKEIATLEAKAKKRPRSFIAKLELKSELAGLPALREARDRLAKGAERLTEDIATYEREKATAQANLETLAAREAELTALFSNDPEIRNAAVAALDKRIAKVETNIRNNEAGLKEKGVSKTTRESRERELRKYKKELRELMAKRSAQFGIKRTQLSETGRKAAQPVEEGERLGARKVGAAVRAKRTAGNIRTGNLEAVEKRKGPFAKPSDATSLPEERKLSTRSKIQEGGKARETAPIAPVEEAESVEDRILGEMDALEKVRMTVEDRLVDAVADGNTEETTRLRGVRDKIDSQMAEKQAELKAATKGKPRKVAMEYTTATRTESNPAVREAVMDGRLMEALDRLAVEGANDLIRQVAKELSPLVMRTKVRMDPNLTVDGKAVPAAFGVDTNTISFRPTEISDEDIIHEATHAATMRVLRASESELTPRQFAAKRELQAIFANLKEKRTDIAREYGLKDVEEFVSEVQSNVEFRAAINKQPWYKQLWTAIVRLFSKASAETVSERASRLVRDIYLPSKKITTPAGAPAVASVFRTPKPRYESENDLTELADSIIAQPKDFKERMGSNLALEAEMNTADMRAAVNEVLKRGAKEMGDDSLYTQAIYNVRKADQFMPQVQASLTTGPLETYTDDKGLRGIRSSNKDSAVDVIAAAKNVPAKNSEGKFSLATTYMIAQRAANKGLSKLDLGALDLSEAKLAAAMAAADADPTLKSALEEVRRRYNAYNEGQIKFLAEMGAISKATAKEWLKEGDYVPYYRVRDDGTAELVLGGEKTITVGDIRTQPYLAELKGGDTKILPLNESIIRNTMLITKAALYNGASKEFAYAMQEFGKGKGEVDPKTGKPKDLMPIHKGQGPDGTNIIRFSQEPDPKDPKDDGKRWLRIVTKGTAMEGIPAELVVKSLEGAHLTLPAFLKIGGIAGDWLRKGVTRMPPYIFRQLIRDPMAASFTGGLNYGPFRAVVMAGTEFLRSSAGRSEGYKKLIEKGLVQSGVFTGDPDDMSAFALQLASGKDGKVIDRFLGMLDRAAIRADAATRLLVHDNAVKNGLSEVEADLMTMESMNFYKRGLSPTVQYANRLIPFMNAQIQGLNVLAKAMRGNMPFEDRQRIQRKFWNNAVMLFGVGLVYAMAMEDDETFKNAKPRDKYTNFFVHLPGVSEAVKIPLPYESGWFFTAAVALADAMKAEVKGEQQLTALRDIFLSSIPGYSSKFMPQAIKPLLEVYTNKNFFSGQNIESLSMQNRSPEERFSAATTEAAKALGKVLPLSPIQIEHLAKGYFGTAPLALMSAASSFMREEGVKGEAPERRLSETPILGTVFQKKYGGADANTMYAFAKEATQRAASLKDIQKTDPAAAREYLASHRTEIALAPMARQFETVMGRLRTQENLIRNRKDLSAEEKRARIDQIDKARQDVADRFNAAVRRAEAARAS